MSRPLGSCAPLLDVASARPGAPARQRVWVLLVWEFAVFLLARTLWEEILTTPQLPAATMIACGMTVLLGFFAFIPVALRLSPPTPQPA